MDLKNYMPQLLYILIIFSVLILIWYMMPCKKELTEQFNSNKKVVFLYAPWCGYCTQFMPIWDGFVEKNKSNPNVEYLKLKEGDELFETYKSKVRGGLKGFPTVFSVDSNGKFLNMLTTRDENGLSKLSGN